jgi:hypothetical protein
MTDKPQHGIDAGPGDSDFEAALRDGIDRGLLGVERGPVVEQFFDLDPKRHLPIHIVGGLEAFLNPAFRNLDPNITREQFSDLCLRVEYERSHQFGLLVGTCARRQENLRQVETLLDRIWRYDEPFALYLRNFDVSSYAYPHSGFKVAVMRIDRGNTERAIADAVEVVPVLKIHNMEDFDYVLPAFEAGDDWRETVEALVRRASIILFAYSKATPGVSYEWQLLERTHRVKDTFLLLGEGECELPFGFEGAAGAVTLEALASSSRARVQQLASRPAPETGGNRPKPSSHWMRGIPRSLFISVADANLHQAEAWLAGTTFEDPDLVYAALDVGALSLGVSLALEDTTRIARAALLLGRARLWSYPRIDAAGYFEWAAQHLPLDHPHRLCALQLWALECEKRLDDPTSARSADLLSRWQDAVRLARERFDGGGRLEAYLHSVIGWRVARRAGTGVDSARAGAKAAYADYRQAGEAPLFRAARSLAILSYGLVKVPGAATRAAVLEALRSPDHVERINSEFFASVAAALVGELDWSRVLSRVPEPDLEYELEVLREHWSRDQHVDATSRTPSAGTDAPDLA